MGTTVVLAFLIPLALAPGRAATYLVRPDGTGDFPTIQAAVDAVTDGDVIELADGTFTGDGNRDVDYLGKAITIRSQSGDAASCVIDCGGSPGEPHRGFQFLSHEDRGSRLEGVTVTGAHGSGGAIYILESGPTVSACEVRGNQTSGIYVVVGGYLSLQTSIEDCLVTGNTSESGAGIWTGAPTTIVGCTISGNAAQWGGGLVAIYGLHVVERTVLWGNCADQYGPEAIVGDGVLAFDCSAVDSSGVLALDAGDVVYFANNVFANPIFCDPAPCEASPTTAGDYRVDAASMCLPAVSPCGEPIGALGQGCTGTVPVAKTTWGRVKALFHER